MGFVKIASVKTPEEARGLWSSFLDLSERNREHRVCTVPEKIENGSRLFLADGQSFVLFAEDKFLDTAYGPGIYVYLDVFAGDGCDDERMKKYTEILKGRKPDAFTDEIPEGVLPEGFLFMRQESKPIPFTFDEATYHDFERKMDIVLQGSGYFVLQEANLRVNYALADFSKEKLLDRMLPEFSEEEKKRFALEVESSFERTFEQVSSMTHFSYEHLPHISPVVTSLVNGERYDAWVLGKGIILKEIQFRTFYPSEKCLPELVQREKVRRAEKARTQATKAQEEAQAAAREQQQAAQVQASAVNRQAASQTMQTTWQPVSGNGGDWQEHIVRTGGCGWAKGGLNLINGKATLTNKRFSFTASKLGQIDKLLFNNVSGKDCNFEFLLSEIVNITETKQGIADALEIQLKNGQIYKCSFHELLKYTSHEWLATIKATMNNYQG